MEWKSACKLCSVHSATSFFGIFWNALCTLRTWKGKSVWFGRFARAVLLVNCRMNLCTFGISVTRSKSNYYHIHITNNQMKDFNIEPVNSLDSLILIQPHTIVLHNIYKCMAKFSEPMRTLQKPQEKIIEILFDFDRCFLFMLRNRNGNSMKNFSKNFHQS